MPGVSAARAERLLVLCATAIQNQNAPVVQQAVQALQSISSIDGEPNERVTAYFLRALSIRAGGLLQGQLDEDPTGHLDHPHQVQWGDRRLGFNELTNLVDMTPYYRFGYMAANGAILEALEGVDRVHIIDFSTSHCMQWPTLIDALADRMGGPPHVRLTVASGSLPTPPRLQPTYEEVGHRLALWAGEKKVPFEFRILSRPLERLRTKDIDLRDGESLAVNCSLRLHYLADESAGFVSEASSETIFSPRDKFLQLIRGLNPTVVTLYEEDCNTTSVDLVTRLKEAYNHEWISFDYLATYSQNGSHGRLELERAVGQKIENIIACENFHRIERLESKSQWAQRMQRLNFRALPVSEDVVAALREMVGDYAVGWGMKLDEDDVQVLSWKGHSLAFASSWVPYETPSKLA